MTHSASLAAADSPPAMYRRATLAMLVSITSMNAGRATAAAISHGLRPPAPDSGGGAHGRPPARRGRRGGGSRRGWGRGRLGPAAGRRRRAGSRVTGTGVWSFCPAFGPGRRVPVVDVRGDRQADEQRGVGRRRLGQLDPDREPLHHLDEVPGGVLRRQQGQRRAGPRGEPGHPARGTSTRSPYMSTCRSTGWPIRRSASWVSLKLASTQTSVSDWTAMSCWPAWTVLPGLTLRRDDHPVDLGPHLAVAQVEPGVLQFLLGLGQLGPGLEDGRGVVHDPLQELLDRQALGVLVEPVEVLLRGLVRPRQRKPELGGDLDEVRQGDAHAGEGLADVRRHLVERGPGRRPGRQPEPDAGLVHLLLGLAGLGLGHPERLPAEVQLLLGDGLGPAEALGPGQVGPGPLLDRLLAVQCGHPGLEQGRLVGHLLDGRLELPAAGAGGRLGGAGPGLGRLSDRPAPGRRPPPSGRTAPGTAAVQLNQQVPGRHLLGVLDQDALHLPADPRGDQGDVPGHVGVVGRDGGEGRDRYRNKSPCGDAEGQQNGGDDRPAPPLPTSAAGPSADELEWAAAVGPGVSCVACAIHPPPGGSFTGTGKFERGTEVLYPRCLAPRRRRLAIPNMGQPSVPDHGCR